MLRRWDVRAIVLSVILGASLAAVAQEQPLGGSGRGNMADRLHRYSRVGESAASPQDAAANDEPTAQQAEHNGRRSVAATPVADTQPQEPRTAGRSSRRSYRGPQPGQPSPRPLATPARPSAEVTAEPQMAAPPQSGASTARREPTPAKREPTLAKPRSKQPRLEPTPAPTRNAAASEPTDNRAPTTGGSAAGASSDPELTPAADATPALEPAASEPPSAGEPTLAQPAPAAASPRSGGSRSLQDRLSRARRTAPSEPAATEPAATPAPASEPAAAPAEELSEPAAEPPREAQRTARVERPHLPNPETGLAVSPIQRRGAADEMHLVHQSPLLGVETSGPRKIKVNEPATYRVVARNVGHGAAQQVVVTIRLPEWADMVGSETQVGVVQTPAAGTSDGVQWHIDELAGNSQAEMSLQIVPRKSRPFDLAVQWSHSPVSTNAMVEVQEAKLLMALSGPDEVFFGEQEVYKLTLSNPGTGDAEDVVVRLLPSVPGEAATASHEIGVIPAGHTKVVELELTARDPGRLMINAEATAAGGLQAQVAEEVLVRRAELDVKLSGPKTQYAGAVATYVVQVANPGNAVAKNVEVAFLLPAGATFVADNAGGRLEGKGTKVVWRLPNLRPDAPLRFEVKCKLEAPGANHPQAVCQAEGDLRDAGTLSTQVEALADLRLEVFDPQGPVAVGDSVEFEIHVKNRGNKAAENVEVVAFFSEGVEPIGAAGEGHELGVGQVAFAPLAAVAGGHEEVLRLTARGQAPGNHMIRVQVRCQQLNTLLTQEESTLFYQADQEVSDAAAAQPAAGDGYEAGADENWQPDPDGQTLPEDVDEVPAQ